MHDYKRVIKGLGCMTIKGVIKGLGCMTIKGYKRIRMHDYKGL